MPIASCGVAAIASPLGFALESMHRASCRSGSGRVCRWLDGKRHIPQPSCLDRGPWASQRTPCSLSCSPSASMDSMSRVRRGRSGMPVRRWQTWKDLPITSRRNTRRSQTRLTD